MKLLPEYCHNIVIGVIYKRQFSWYVTKVNLWYLDYQKYYETMQQKYIDMKRTIKRFIYDIGTYEYFCGTRWGIENVLSDKSVSKFLDKIEVYRTNYQELKDFYNKCENGIECLPVVLVDFDRKHLFNYIQEPYFLHEYVPKGWKGTYENFYRFIPENQKFFTEQ